MKTDRRVPLSAAAYQAAKDSAGNLSLSEFVSTVLIQVLQPVDLPVTVLTRRELSPEQQLEQRSNSMI